MNADLVPIPVPGTDRQVMATLIDGKSMVSLRHACDAMGINYSGQYERLNRTSWATVRVIGTVAADGKSREMAMVDRRTFTMWLATSVGEGGCPGVVEDAPAPGHAADFAATVAAYRAVSEWFDADPGRDLNGCTPSMVAGVALAAYRKALTAHREAAS